MAAPVFRKAVSIPGDAAIKRELLFREEMKPSVAAKGAHVAARIGDENSSVNRNEWIDVPAS
jgi:hypothetical protein